MASRSFVLSRRHSEARKKRRLFRELTGKEGNYRDFLRNETPLEKSITVYDVSFQMSYTKNGSLIIPESDTYKVFAFDMGETENTIRNKTVQSVQNMSSSRGGRFHIETQALIERELKVNIGKSKPRGAERGQSPEITPEIVSKLVSGGGSFVQNNDLDVVIEGRGADKSPNSKTTRAVMKADLSRYIN